MIRTSVEPAEFRSGWLAVADTETDYSCVAEVDGDVAGIGYVVRPEFWGRQVASRVARGLVDAAFGDLGLRRLTAGAFADNVASCRVLEKVGMRREQYGVKDSWHAERGWIDGVT